MVESATIRVPALLGTVPEIRATRPEPGKQDRRKPKESDGTLLNDGSLGIICFPLGSLGMIALHVRSQPECAMAAQSRIARKR